MSPSPPPDALLERARQGHPQAIAAWMNQQLQSEQITAAVARRGHQLNILLTTPHQPPSLYSVTLLHILTRRLNLTGIELVNLHGGQPGRAIPAWSRTYDPHQALDRTLIAQPVSVVSEVTVEAEASSISSWLARLYGAGFDYLLAGLWCLLPLLDDRTRTLAWVLAITEVLAIQALGFALATLLNPTLDRHRTLQRLGILMAVLGAIATALAWVAQSWWPLLSLPVLTGSRLLSAVFNTLPPAAELQLSIRRWRAGSTLLAIALVVGLMTQWLYGPVLIYFVCLGTSELFDHRWVGEARLWYPQAPGRRRP